MAGNFETVVYRTQPADQRSCTFDEAVLDREIADVLAEIDCNIGFELIQEFIA
ncbi:hypothetical protein D3C80_1348560 [compost metagenome]